MATEYNVNDIINGLLEQVAQQARELAMLRVQVALANRTEEGVDEVDAND